MQWTSQSLTPAQEKRAERFEAARVRSKEQVSGSEAIVKPQARESAQMPAMAPGSSCLDQLFIGDKKSKLSNTSLHLLFYRL